MGGWVKKEKGNKRYKLLFIKLKSHMDVMYSLGNIVNTIFAQ